MADFLDILVRDAKKTIESGYYEIESESSSKRNFSLKDSITKCSHAPIIAEIKPASPSHGNLRNIGSLRDVALAMERGGAAGISVLTEPKHFRGSVKSLVEVQSHVNLPVLMKDIIIDPVQIEAASKIGADAIVLIFSVFERGYIDRSVHEMVKLAHSKKLEVLLETHTKAQFLAALETEADLVGINNRDLKTLKVDLKVTRQVMSVVDKRNKIVVSESGIQKPEDIRFLHACGAKAFLVGSAIMLADDIEGKVRELVHAL
ncbi:MAG: indole-3-glycerol-phosphate synthase [Candidatus Bathyarchaeales archaeon]